MNVTVVITNKNYGHMIDTALESCIKQTIKPNIIVVDDGSTDSSLDIYSKYKDYINVLRNNNSLGPAVAKNAGIECAWDYTDIFAFLDADDYYNQQNSLEQLIYPFSLSSKVGVSYSDCTILDDVQSRHMRLYREPYVLERFVSSDTVGGNILVSQKALGIVGKFDTNMKVVENYELVKRISEKFVPIHIPENLITVRITNVSLVSTVPKNEWEYYWQQTLAKAKTRSHV